MEQRHATHKQQPIVLGEPQGSQVPTLAPYYRTYPAPGSSQEQDGTLSFLFAQRRTRQRRSVRSKNAIVAAILDACRTPIPQHLIMVKARLGYDTFWHHTNKLLSMGVVDETKEGNKTLYHINAKGLALLSELTGQ